MISVIIPAYNVENYIRRCVESILAGSYEDFEIIIIDDGSGDGTLNQCRELAERDARIKVYTQNNRGVGKTRNRGLELASGDYIAFVDADDYVSEDYLSEMNTIIDETGVDWVACAYNYISRRSARKVIKKTVFSENVCCYGHEARSLVKKSILSGEVNTNLFSNAMGLYKKSMIDEGGCKIDDNLLYGEDVLFNLAISSIIDGFAYTTKPIYQYCENVESFQQSWKGEASIKEIMDFVSELGRRYGDDPDVKSECTAYIFSNIKYIITGPFMKAGSRSQRKNGYKVLDEYLKNEQTAYTLNRIKPEDLPGWRDKIVLYLLKKGYYRLLDILPVLMKIKNA